MVCNICLEKFKRKFPHPDSIEAFEALHEQANQTNQRLNEQVTQIGENFNQVNQYLDNLREVDTQIYETINRMVENFNRNMERLQTTVRDQQKEIQKLKKENKIFKSAFWLYISLIEEYHPIFSSGFFKAIGEVYGGSSPQNEVLIKAIKEKWGYFPGASGEFNRNSVSDYNGYKDSDV